MLFRITGQYNQQFQDNYKSDVFRHIITKNDLSIDTQKTIDTY